MKIFKSNIHKLSLSLVLTGTAFIGQMAWSADCERSYILDQELVNDFDYNVYCLSDGLMRFKKDDDGYGYADSLGNIVIPAQYYNATDFHNGFARVVIDKKWHIMDKSGKASAIPQLPNGYMDFGKISDGMMSARINRGIDDSYWGFIDTNGNQAIPAQYSEVGDFSEGLVRVKFYRKGWWFIDKSGNSISNEYYIANDFKGGLALVAKTKGYDDNFRKYWGFIDKSGKEVISLEYDDAKEFSENLAVVQKNKKYGFIDKSGKEVIGFQYDSAGSFLNGLAEVKKDGRYGVIDKSGKIIIPFKYSSIKRFGDLFIVQQFGLQGIVDKTGREIALIEYENIEIEKSQKDMAKFTKGNEWGYFDNKGRVAFVSKYSKKSVGSFSGDMAWFGDGSGKYGYIDRKGEVAIKPQFSCAFAFRNGKAIVCRGNEKFVIDKQGNPVYP